MSDNIDNKEVNINEELYWVCWHDNIKEAEALLKAGANPNIFHNDSYHKESNETPLLHIMENSERSLKFTNLLIDYKADVNLANKDGESPLMVAIACNAPFSTIKLLVDNGADLNCKDNDGNSIIWHMLYDRELQDIEKLTKFFIKSGYDEKQDKYILVDILANSDNTHISNSNLEKCILNILMDAGADITAVRAEDENVAHFLHDFSNEFALKCLKKGLDFNTKDRCFYQGNQGNYPAINDDLPRELFPEIFSSERTKTDLFNLETNLKKFKDRKLLDKILALKWGEEEYTTLFHIDDEKVAEIVCDICSKKQLNQQDIDGNSVIMTVPLSVAKVMLKKGADPKIKNKKGLCFLDRLAEKKKIIEKELSDIDSSLALI